MPWGRRRVPAVIFCHGLTGSKDEIHFLFVKLARALASRGIVAYRFDFRGSGESEGKFSSMTVSGEISDARAALRVISRWPGVDRRRLGLLGLSMGGCVAAHVAASYPGVRSLALWAAVGKPADTVQKFISSRRAGARGHFDLGGLELGAGFMRDARRIDPFRALRRSSRRFPVLVAHGGRDRVVPIAMTERYFTALHQARYPVRKLIIEGADHTFNRINWTRDIVSATTTWFARTLGAGKA